MSENGIRIEGRFERWVLGVIAALIAAGVVGVWDFNVRASSELSALRTDMGWIKGRLIEINEDRKGYDKRLNALERQVGR